MNILLRRRKLGNGSCNGIKAASTTGIDVWRNDLPRPVGELNYVFRWGCTSNIPEREGVVVVNTAASIHWCSNKRQGRLDMQAAGVSVPKTWAVNADGSMGAGYEGTYVLGSGPIIARPTNHAQGKQLFSGGWGDAVRQAAAWGGGYISEFINKVAEYRVAVIQNRVAWVAQKTPGNPDDVAWNVAQGGRFDNVKWGNWPAAVIKEALAAAKVSGTDFCGVDVMTTEDGKAYVLEVNSAPSQTSAYRQSCFAKCFDHIVTNGKAHFGDPAKFGWKSTIHPALLVDRE
jgi:glutathione synthase/RimK-type ligase-like ATP-grasp enzyme